MDNEPTDYIDYEDTDIRCPSCHNQNVYKTYAMSLDGKPVGEKLLVCAICRWCVEEHKYYKTLKELNMSKKDEVTITKDALDKTYREGCSDVKKVLKNLFPDHEFEKPIELKDGQIWKKSTQYPHEYIRICLVDNSDNSWVMDFLDIDGGHSPIKDTTDTIDWLKRNNYFLCPNAKIIVKENEDD